jgi:predicted HTH domain antitoxin
MKAAVKFERIDVEIPSDILFAMRGLRETEDVRKKLKASLAIVLFQEKSISLGKATELAEMNRVRFIEFLKEHGIPAYEYTDEDFEKDKRIIEKYRLSER